MHPVAFISSVQLLSFQIGSFLIVKSDCQGHLVLYSRFKPSGRMNILFRSPGKSSKLHSSWTAVHYMPTLEPIPIAQGMWHSSCLGSTSYVTPQVQILWAQAGEKCIPKWKLRLHPAEGIMDAEMPRNKYSVQSSRRIRCQYLSLSAISGKSLRCQGAQVGWGCNG